MRHPVVLLERLILHDAVGAIQSHRGSQRGRVLLLIGDGCRSILPYLYTVKIRSKRPSLDFAAVLPACVLACVTA